MRIGDIQRTVQDGIYIESAAISTDDGRAFDVFFAMADGLLRPSGSSHFYLLGHAMAFVLREEFENAPEADSVLSRNVQALKLQWRQWGRDFRRVKKRRPAPFVPVDGFEYERLSPKGPRNAAFFSGGVDALFSCQALGDEVTTLVTIAHCESEPLAAMERAAELAAFANATGRRHVVVATNLMSVLPEFQDQWTDISHGPALGAVAHFLDSEIDRIVISSSHDYGGLMNWGSHPLTDPLLSGGRLKVVNYGGQFTRLDKTIAIAKSPDALRVLSVCSQGRLAGIRPNCSQCQKCLRTMVGLDLAGVDRSLAVTFDWAGYDPSLLGDVFFAYA